VLTLNELLLIKSRLLLGAETADRIAGMGGEPLSLDEETYQLVMQALLSMKGDVRKVLAEIDILRGMVTGKFDTLFAGEDEHGRSSNVERPEPQEVGSGGGGERTDSAGAGGSVRSGGPDRKATRRSRPRRNRRKDGGDSAGLDTTSRAEPVDSSTEVAG
jgi:hypothetical protein